MVCSVNTVHSPLFSREVVEVDRSLSSRGRHLGFFMGAKPGESTKCLWVGALRVNSVEVQPPVPLPTGIL